MANKIDRDNPVAIARYVRIAPNKARRYAELIVGMKYDVAMAQLDFQPSPVAKVIRKLLATAGANAEENFNMTNSSTIVKKACVDQGPTLKRWLPRAMGRATRIRKRTSHITIVLAEEEI